VASISEELGLNVAEQYRSWFQSIEIYDRSHSTGGPNRGPIGLSGLEVAKEIANQAEDGAVHIAVDVLAGCIGRSRQTVNNAIRRLQNAGFIAYHPGSRGAPATLKPTVRR